MGLGAFGWGAARDRFGTRTVVLAGAALLGLALSRAQCASSATYRWSQTPSMPSLHAVGAVTLGGALSQIDIGFIGNASAATETADGTVSYPLPVWKSRRPRRASMFLIPLTLVLIATRYRW